MAPKPPIDGSREQELQKHLFAGSLFRASTRRHLRVVERHTWHSLSNGTWLCSRWLSDRWRVARERALFAKALRIEP